jgi:hypothetical protein
VPVTALLAAALSAASPSWALPVDGAVAAGFRYDAARPFAAGARRGADLRAAAGSAVRAACSGRVSHAGAVPRWRVGVSVRCGRLVATHLGLRDPLVRRGERVDRGQRIGRVGPAGVVRLGARVRSERFGWVDPLALIAQPHPRGAPLGPAPPSSGPRSAPLPAARPSPRPTPRASRAHSPPAAPRAAPVLAWGAAALVAAGLPLGPVLATRRRRRRAAAREQRGTLAAAEDAGLRSSSVGRPWGPST